MGGGKFIGGGGGGNKSMEDLKRLMMEGGNTGGGNLHTLASVATSMEGFRTLGKRSADQISSTSDHHQVGILDTCLIFSC